MGFPPPAVLAALQRTHGNMETAVELLTAQKKQDPSFKSFSPSSTPKQGELRQRHYSLPPQQRPPSPERSRGRGDSTNRAPSPTPTLSSPPGQ